MLTLCALLPAHGEELKAPASNKAQNFTLQDAQGKPCSLDDFAGKWVVLEWINFKCPFVNKFYNSGAMQKWQDDYGKRGVIWLTICSSAKGKPGYFTAEELQKILPEKKMKSARYLVDDNGTVGKNFGAKTTPTMVVISPNKDLIYNGAIDSISSTEPADISKADNYLVKALDAALEGKKLDYKKTVAYGCGVKY